MTLTIELKPEVEILLKQKASAKGCAVDDYVENLIERDVNRQKTLDEIFAPVRQEFKEQGMTEEGLDDLIYQARREVFAEKKARENK
jgi:hypothetical protein